MTYARFWSDDFDMDLSKILPDLDGILGDTAAIPLWVHAGTSHDRLNHPAVWGTNAFYGLTPDSTGKPDSYHTDLPLIGCTWREAIRDAWPHTYRLNIDGRQVWDARQLWPLFNDLMADVRGWRALPDAERERLLGCLRLGVESATARLRLLAAEESR